jgi:hypothetical protein
MSMGNIKNVSSRNLYCNIEWEKRFMGVAFAPCPLISRHTSILVFSWENTFLGIFVEKNDKFPPGF